MNGSLNSTSIYQTLSEKDGEENENIQEDPGASLLFKLRDSYEAELIFVGFLTLIAFLLMIFNETFMHLVAKRVPESVLLISLGMIFAKVGKNTFLFQNIHDKINAHTFFNFLLPPIILNAAYQLYNKQFLFNLDGIFITAIGGTLLNIYAIGMSLYGTYGYWYGISPLKCLLYSTMISAVDPVAVLAVFKQIGVEKGLYFLIFGESLFNDGVTVVVFDTYEKIAFVDDINASTFAYGTISFIPVAGGGVLIGIIYGLISSLACKYTSVDSKLLEPTLMILSAYLAFLNAQYFHWSGIMALIGCGLIQKRYGFENLFEKSRVTIEVGVEILAVVSETIIFLMLGLKVLDTDIEWDYKLILWSLLFCIIYRFVFVFAIGYFINTYRLHKLTFNHLFMISYGGLRGAVSFAMAASLHDTNVKELFMGATLAVILTTVMFQGTTIKFLVDIMNFKEQEHSDNFTSATIQRVNFHVLAGMETILGGGGSTIHYWFERIELFDKTYMQPIMCSKGSDEKRLAAMIKNQGKGISLSNNNVLWGSHDYAKQRIAQHKGGKGDLFASPDIKQKRINDLSKYREAIKEKKDEIGTESIILADERLNEALKKKQDLMRAMKQATIQPIKKPMKKENGLKQTSVSSSTTTSSSEEEEEKQKALNTVHDEQDKNDNVKALGPYSEHSSTVDSLSAISPQNKSDVTTVPNSIKSPNNKQ